MKSMSKQVCFLCEQELGMLNLKWSAKGFLSSRVPIPEGMNEEDRVCNECYNLEKKQVKEELKEAKEEFKEITVDLLKRTPEYKKQWDKDGIIQFKNERMAILQKALGKQVEFIIAFDDLTKEGYKLMAIQEIQSADGKSVSGINSNYFFQKI